MALGSYPETSLAQARDIHAENRRMRAAGVDPMARRKSEKTAEHKQIENAFETITNRWLNHWKEDKSLRHVDSTRRRLDANILPYLGKLAINEIVATDIVAMVRAVEERGARDVAKRALETTGQIFRYAIAHGHAARNPAADIKPRGILKPALKTNYARISERDLSAPRSQSRRTRSELMELGAAADAGDIAAQTSIIKILA